MSQLNRRNAPTAFAALLAMAVPAAAISVPTLDADLLRLGEELKRKWSVMRELEDARSGVLHYDASDDDASDEEFEAAYDACRTVVEQIEHCVAP